ncbi:MAG TPA: ATP-binding protein [Herpetosiphonaceae bacterium]
MTSPTRLILIIDDTPEDRELYKRLLRRDSSAVYEVAEAATAADGIALCGAIRPDVVLIDYLLPDDNGLDVVSELVAAHGDAAFGILMLTGAGDEQIAVQALHRGADDYLVKSARIERQLPLAIERALATVALRRQVATQRADLERGHVQLQEALALAQRHADQLHLALQAGGMAAWEIDWPTQRVTWSQWLVASEFAGLDAAEHTLADWVRQVHEDDRPAMEAWLAQVLAGAAPASMPFRMIGADQSTRWMEASGSREQDGDDATVRLFGIVQDITQRKQIEAELWRREAEFKTLVENGPDIIARFDPELRHVYVSPMVTSTTGFPQAAFIGKTNQELGMPPEQCALWDQAIAQVFATGQPAEIEFAFPSAAGAYSFQAMLVPERGPDGGIETVLSTARDVTAYRRAQDRLQFLSDASIALAASLDAAATFRQLALLAADHFGAVCTIDAVDSHGDLRLAAVAAPAPAVETLFEEMRRRYPVRVQSEHPVAVVLRDGAPLARSSLTADFILENTYDAEHRDLAARLDVRSFLMVPLTLRGRTMGVVALYAAGQPADYQAEDRSVLEELTRRAALALDNAQLYGEAQEALRERDAFLSVASHELRNPLTALLGRTQLLQRRLRRLPGTDQVAEDAAVVLALGRRIDGLLHELLDVSRAQSGQLTIAPEPIDAVALWGRVVADLQASTAAHRLAFRASAPSCVVNGDPARLEQVAYNLVNNAIKYSPDGGTVTVALSQPAGGGVQVEVCDEGLGIPAADVQHVFKRFHRSALAVTQHIPGTGIGLYVVSEIVHAHGGTIEVESTEGVGSCFNVWLPFTPPRAQG